MKKLRLFTLAALLLSMVVLNNSCYGPFNLTVKLHSWNSTIGSKWANTAVFFAFVIIPVYEVSAIVDALVFNSIEFWGGNNPVSMNEDDKDVKIVRSGDEEFRITTTKNKILLEQMNGKQAGDISEIIFTPEDNSCYLKHNGELTKLVEYIPSEDGRDIVNLFMPDGSIVAMDAEERNYDAIQTALNPVSHLLTNTD